MQGAPTTRTSVEARRERARVEEALRAGKPATEPRAHPQRPRRHDRVVGDDVEMVIEARDLVDLGHRQPHLGGERHQVPLPQCAMGVLQAVQVLDQPVAPVTFRGRRADGLANLGQRVRGRVPALAREHADRARRAGPGCHRCRNLAADRSTHRCHPPSRSGAIGHTRPNRANVAQSVLRPRKSRSSVAPPRTTGPASSDAATNSARRWCCCLMDVHRLEDGHRRSRRPAVDHRPDCLHSADAHHPDCLHSADVRYRNCLLPEDARRLAVARSTAAAAAQLAAGAVAAVVDASRDPAADANGDPAAAPTRAAAVDSPIDCGSPTRGDCGSGCPNTGQPKTQ